MPYLGRGLAAALVCELLLFPPTLGGDWGGTAWGWSIGMFMFFGPISAAAYAVAFAAADRIAPSSWAMLRAVATVAIPALIVAAFMLPGTMGAAPHGPPRLHNLLFPFAPLTAGALAGAIARETGFGARSGFA